MQKGIRLGLMALAAMGIAIFTLLFSTTFADRADLERAAVFAVETKIKAEVRDRYPALENETFTTAAERLRDRFGTEAEGWTKALEAKLDVVVADAVAKLCGCEQATERHRTSVSAFFQDQESRAGRLAAGLQDFISVRYETVVSGLIRDLRIFSGVNIAAFALVLLLAWLKPSARLHLLLPAGLLFISVILTICLYIFGQNWFYTLVLGNFWGFAYLAYMGIIFSLIVDITLNRARIVTTILNMFSNISLIPC